MAIGFETGKAALALNPRAAFGLTSAANSELLPQPKPRAMREHFVVPSIGSREVARPQRSCVRHCEDALKALVHGTYREHSWTPRKDLLCRPKHAQALPLNISQFLDIRIVGDEVV